MARTTCGVQIVTLNGITQLEAPEPDGDFEMRDDVPYFYHYLNVGDLIQVFELSTPPLHRAYLVRPTQEWADQWNQKHNRIGADVLRPEYFDQRQRLLPGEYELIEIKKGDWKYGKHEASRDREAGHRGGEDT